MNSNNLSVVLATRKGVLFLEKESTGWEITKHSFAGIPVSYAFRHPYSGVLWAALDSDHWGAKLQRSEDEGKTWQDVELPKYPENAMINEETPATLSYIWTIAEGHADRPDDIFLGTEPGGLFYSKDGGASFNLVKSLWDEPGRSQWYGGGRDHPGLHSIVVDPRDADHLLIGISVGGVYESKDGGESWAPKNKGLIAEYLPNPDAEVGHDPHLLAMSPSNPDVLWQQNHCGIFVSRDSVENWDKVSQTSGPAHFGFPIVVDPKNSETAWVIPAVSDEVRMAVDGALCVSRTEDGGKTWTAFREGLPQENCYDVVFRHGFDQMGDVLMFGTTTGNLFVSENRGESWELISSFIPPVYSVRFMK